MPGLFCEGVWSGYVLTLFRKLSCKTPLSRARRSQRDYSLPFKLAVVGEVGRGELSYKQAQRRYGIQGRTTVLT